MESKKPSMKLKALAAAVALAGAGAANAAMDNFQSGNGSLAFVALDFTGSPVSMMMDLDFRLDDFLASSALTSTAGTLIQWDFGLNTLTVNGVVSGTTQDNWSSALSSFNAIAQSTDTKWGVYAGDSLSLSGSTTPIRYLSTAKPGTTLATLQLLTKSNLSSFSLVDLMYNAQNLVQTAASGLNGSIETNINSNGYAGLTLTNEGDWQNKSTWQGFSNVGDTAQFLMADGNNGTSTSRALITQYAGTFNYDAGVLTYAVAAIPEPSEYASLLAGLGMIGFMARRRLNRRG